MQPITKDSSTEEKMQALVKVITAIQALILVEDLGLGTRNFTGSLADLRVYEKQLLEYLGH